MWLPVMESSMNILAKTQYSAVQAVEIMVVPRRLQKSVLSRALRTTSAYIVEKSALVSR